MAKWTSDDVLALREAVNKKANINDLAASIGKSTSSIFTKKSDLGIKGSFAKGATKSLKATVVGKVNLEVEEIKEVEQEDAPIMVDGKEIYVIETTVVPVKLRGIEQKMIDKVKHLLSIVEPGQSFVIETRMIRFMNEFEKADFSHYKLKKQRTDKSKKFTRIYRLA